MALTKLDKVFLFGPATHVVHKVSCDICGQVDLTKYVYGALRSSRTWAELCVPCYVQHGTSVGGRWRGKVYGWNSVTNTYETNIALTERFMQLLQDIKVATTEVAKRKSNNIVERDICDIASAIEQEWRSIHYVSYTALPYLDAMFNLRTMQDTYNGVPAINVVRSFLMYANADRWRGTTARRIRLELKRKIRRGVS